MEYLEQHQLFIVLIVVLTNWFGLLWYLFKLDSKIKKIEQSLKK